MPTYEYACDECQHQFEEFQSIKADALTVCPQCGQPKLRRLIGTGAGFIFKGSGFYITDYRSSSYKNAEKAERDSQTKPETKPETKTESKSDNTSSGSGKAAASPPTTTTSGS